MPYFPEPVPGNHGSSAVTDGAAAVLDPVLHCGGAGGASVAGRGRCVAAPMAALANGGLAQGHDFDHTHATTWARS